MKSRAGVPLRRWERLSRMRGFGVGSNHRDPRGWTVVDRDRRPVGEVKDLVVDTDRMTATYLDVELNHKLFDVRDADPHVLVPIEYAQPDGRRVVVDAISPRWFDDLRSARDVHEFAFWDEWWARSGGHATAGHGPVISRVDRDQIERAIDDVRPGERVRIPVADEEIVIERRPVARDAAPVVREIDERGEYREDYVVNRALDEPPMRRR